ncbi:hypothetical protein GCM10011348_11470 [Marinobacterium nitratireducens]|uniref:Ig-like domain (Group 3) n=1 Tax=Marinobacterium nitratireducens TaxID=518897 RepID=A0A918DRD6_9GAMM|nr:Ig-like domain-containing protein [Marinobacterium nitratireducens]GGO78760.1 hypothetical protein GCM10011348_11470 [Marinobacterium nitratireducens]
MPVLIKVSSHGDLSNQKEVIRNADVIELTEAGDITLDIAPDQIASLSRSEDDLIIELLTGETITLGNFFLYESESHLYLQGADFDGEIWLADIAADPVPGPLPVAFNAVADTFEELDGGMFLAGAMGAGLAALAASGASGGGGSSSGSRDETAENDEPSDDSDTVGDGEVDDGEGLDTLAPSVGLDPVVTNDETPALGGTVDDPDATVVVTVDGKDYEAVNNGDGTWSLPDGALDPLPEGDNEISVTATDGAGNSSTETETVTVDQTAPEVTFDTEVTNDDTPALSGTVDDPDATVVVTVDGKDYEAVNNGDGTWSLPDGALDPLAEGNNDITVTATDAVGNETVVTGTLTVDTTAPAAPTINPTDGTLLAGSAEAGSRVDIDVDGDGSPDYSVMADSAGNWSVDLDPDLADGTEVTATATDAAGNESPEASATVDMSTPDITPPAAPTIGGALDDVGTITGSLSSGDSTDDTTPTLSGTAEANSTVTIFQDGGEIGAVVADGSGNWSYTPAALTDGSYSFTATATDAAGNESGLSAAFELNVDTSAPAAPTINPTDGTLLAGSAEAGSTVEIDVDGDGSPDYSVMADSAGNWSVDLDPDLADGTEVTATATDAAGNVSPESSATVDMSTPDITPPAAPTIGGALDDVGTITGSLSSGDSTDDTTPTLSGTAEANSTVTIFQDGSEIGTATADGSGNWSFTPAALADGSYSYTVTATDAAGNESGTSPAFELTIDTTAPTTGDGSNSIAFDDGGDELLSATEAGSVTLSGVIEAGATVDGISISDGVTTLNVAAGDISVDGSGNVSVAGQDLSGLANGTLTVTMTVSDAAGNSGDITDTTTLDTTGPATGDGSNAIAFDDGGDELLSAAEASSVTLSGTVESGATVDGIAISDGVTTLNVAAGDISVDGSGNVSVAGQDLSGLADGTLTVTMTVSDAAGNSGDITDTTTLDTTAPAAPVIDPTDGTVITGTAEANSTVNIDVGDDGSIDYTVVADGSGNWSVDADPDIADATVITATATDAAGNVSPEGSVTVDAGLVDVTPPAQPVISHAGDDVAPLTDDLASGDSTNDTTPTLVGTAEAGSTVEIFQDGGSVATVTADGSGNWSYTSAALADATYEFTVTAEDAAGNTSVLSAPFELTIDTTAPAAPTIVSAADDVGALTDPLSSGDSTDDTTPTLTGTSEANSTVTIFQDGSEIGTATADGSGDWTFTPAMLADGSYSFTATATDAAGNDSALSAAFALTIDTAIDADADGSTVSIDSITVDDGVDNADFITSDTSLLINGTLDLDDGTSLSVEFDGTTYTAADSELSVDGSGNWTLDLTASPLAEGSYSATATATDAAGNSVSDSKSVVVQANAAPVVTASSSTLLGLVGADALDLIDLSTQALTAFDRDGNLEQVEIVYNPLLAVLNNGWSYSADLADELGISVNVVTNTVLITGLVTDSTLTITAAGGGVIDNLAINELLASVTLDSAVLNADLLAAITITATDSDGLSDSAGAGSLADANVLDTGDDALIEGTPGNGDETLDGTSASDRLYGYDGNDTLNGNGGDDLLRGGAGDDVLNGDGGDDLLIYDGLGSDTFNGGDGEDVLLLTGDGIVLDFVDSASGDYIDPTRVNDIEQISLGGSGANDLILDEDAIVALTDADDLLYVTGDQGDSVQLDGAVQTGTGTTAGGNDYVEYQLGVAIVQVDDDLTVIGAV